MKKFFCSLLFLIILLLPVVAQTLDNENLRITNGPYLQNISETGATIMWVTNKCAIPAVIITDQQGNERRYMNSTDGIIDGGGMLHKVRIDGLAPGTKYIYKPVSTELLRYQPYKVLYGDTLSRGNWDFTTLDPNKKEVKALVLNDIHEKSFLINDYLEEVDSDPIDMVLFNGDIINHLQREDQIFDGFLDSSVYYFAKEIPFHYVRGNHESRGMLAREFKNYFDFPDDKFYYGFTQGPVHFLILDCGEDKPDDNRYYYGLADYDNYRLEELEWLRSHVKTKEYLDAKYRVVIIHMPIIKREEMWHGMQFLSDHFGPVLKGAGVDLMISGHTHRVKYYTEESSGFGYPVMVSSNITFVEIGATGSGLSAVMKDTSGVVLMEKAFK